MISIALPCMSMEHVGRRLGWIIVNLDAAGLCEALKTYCGDDFDAVATVLRGQTVLLAHCSVQAQEKWMQISQRLSSKLFAPIAQETVFMRNQEMLVTGYPVISGYILVAMRDFQAISAAIWPTLQRILALLLVSTTCLVSLLTAFMLHIAKPTRELVDAMNAVSRGNLETVVHIRTGDEFEQIGDGFNHMTQRLSVFLQQSIEQEALRHRLEQELLISQIKPHFIYNTLNTVIYLAEKGGNRDIVELVHALIALLRDSIHQGNQPLFATVEREIALLLHYMTIQNYRYKDLFQLRIQKQSCSGDEQIPRAILQPLVENALFHGISASGKKGIIDVSIQTMPSGGLNISVRDDGVGIEPVMLQKLRDQVPLEDGTGRSHIGLKNVRKRLELLYPGAYEFQIESSPGQGMCITIRLYPR